MKDKDPIKLERYMFMATYHDMARELINGNDYNAYGHLMFAMNDYVLNGNVPDLNDFGTYERIILKSCKRSLTTTRTKATAGHDGGNKSKAYGNTNASKKPSRNEAETKQKPSRNEAEGKQKPTIENKIENKNEIEEGITSVIPKKNIEKNARALNDNSSIKAKSWNDSNFNENDFMDFYNSTIGNNIALSWLCRFNDKRRKRLREHLQKYGKKKVVEVIQKAATSQKFAHEINFYSRNGKATFEDIFGHYFNDLLNGKYDD